MGPFVDISIVLNASIYLLKCTDSRANGKSLLSFLGDVHLYSLSIFYGHPRRFYDSIKPVTC